MNDITQLKNAVEFIEYKSHRFFQEGFNKNFRQEVIVCIIEQREPCYKGCLLCADYCNFNWSKHRLCSKHDGN